MERNGTNGDSVDNGEPSAKRVRIEEKNHKPSAADSRDRIRGIAPVKAE